MPEDQTNNSGSILDRVLMSQQTVALEHFDPQETVVELLKQVNQKEADVLRRRFGLGEEDRETLEKIGQQYHVTRERVRQIERWAIQHLRKSGVAKQLLHDLDVLLQQLIEEHGGLMLEEDLFAALHSHGPMTKQSQAAVEFLLHELMTDKIERVQEKGYKPYWRMRFGVVDLLPETITQAENIIREFGRPVDRKTLLDKLSATEFVRNHTTLTEAVLLSYLSVATSIERNPFGEFGLREWGSIVPKRMNDKILLVMRKQGKPMHFQDIAQKINELGFDQRQAYAPTVHNELILNDDYVLIGRGIYALREWGYKPGVVADVLEAILREHHEPMERDELVRLVMEQRMVKKNTIHLALTNKSKFRRLEDGRYTLATPSSAS